jgi:hypothetical protein
MKKFLIIFAVVLFAWSITVQAQTEQYDAYKRVKWSSTSIVVDTIIGPNNEADYIYFPMFDRQSGSFYDSLLVIVTLTEIANMDSIRIGFDYSPDNTNWVGTLLDSHFVSASAGVFWQTGIPPNTGGVKSLPYPRYGRFTLWGTMNTGATDSTAFTSYTIYGYKKPTTIIRVRD